MKLHILFLAVRMRPGFGVSVVIEEVAKRLIDRGVEVSIGAAEVEGHFGTLPVHEVAAEPQAVQDLSDRLGASHVIAHTTPFFEILPELKNVETWAWEHGDPDPAFFPDDGHIRQEIIQRKTQSVYPRVHGVIAISRFIRSQIQWAPAAIIDNGWEHILTKPAKVQSRRDNANQRFRVGCLMRLGQGEALYKGGELLLQLAKELQSNSSRIDFLLMGRGSEDDAKPYREAGVEVFLNASDEQREEFIASLDVFVSPSLWEGCNLPILEAQATGIPTIAFDCGAHPETSSVLVSSVDEAKRLIENWASNPEQQQKAALYARQFVQMQFSWDTSTDKLLQTLLA